MHIMHRSIQQLREPTNEECRIIESKHLNAKHWKVAERYVDTLEIVKIGNCQRRILNIG